MDTKRLEEIVAALKRRSVDQPCPRCGHEEFTALAESYLPIAGTGGIFTSVATIPVALIACNRCGFLSPHATKMFVPNESVADPSLTTIGEIAGVGAPG